MTWPDGAPDNAAEIVREIEREHARAIELDGPIPDLNRVREVIVWRRARLPWGVGQWAGWCTFGPRGCWVHLAGREPWRLVRHELHHARLGCGGHADPSWGPIFAELGHDWPP